MKDGYELRIYSGPRPARPEDADESRLLMTWQPDAWKRPEPHGRPASWSSVFAEAARAAAAAMEAFGLALRQHWPKRSRFYRRRPRRMAGK